MVDSIEGTPETIKSEVSVFDQPSFQVTHLKGLWLKVSPTGTYIGTNHQTGLDFHIDRAEGLYLDLNDSFIVVKFHFADANLKPYPPYHETNNKDPKRIALVNFGLAALFRDVSMRINGTKIEGENHMYATKAYMYNDLSAGKNAKRYQLQVCGWMDDDANGFDLETNKGHVTRKAWTAFSKPLELAGPLWLDCWMQPQYLTPDMDIDIHIQRQDPRWCLQSWEATPDTNIIIDEAALWIRKVTVSPSVRAGHLKGLETQNACWHYNGHKIIEHIIPASILTWTEANIARGMFPKLLVICLTTGKAAAGDWKLSPFNFVHQNIQSIGLQVNGSNVPMESYTPDFPNGCCARPYLMCFLGLGKSGIHTDDNGLGFADYMGGHTYFVFNLAADLCLSGHAQPARLSNIKCEIKFKEALTEQMNLKVLCVYDTKFEMTQAGVIIADSVQASN